MKKKIVINVPMHNGKAKAKAMKIAVAFSGVMSVNLGAENDLLEVSGEDVDPVCLANSLRKKFCFANIMSVEEVKPAPPSIPSSSPSKQYCSPPPPYYPPVYYYESRVYDAPPICSIM